MLKKDLEIELRSVEKYCDELRSKVRNLEIENKNLEQRHQRYKSYLNGLDKVLTELSGILIGIKLPDDQPIKHINFRPDDYYNDSILKRNDHYEKENFYTVRDEIRVRLEYIQRNISYMVEKKND